MAETLDAVTQHLGRHGERAKIVVWAHNSHLGDARATEMGRRASSMSASSYARNMAPMRAGRVHDASRHRHGRFDWERRQSAARAPGTSRQATNDVSSGAADPLPPYLREGDSLAQELRNSRLERAIGVIYRPETERMSHYF